MTDAEAKPRLRPEMLARLAGGVEQLLEAGQTYEEIKMDDLARTSGVAKSTFYVYFDDKLGLLSVLAQDVMSTLVDFEHAWWNLDPGPTRDELTVSLQAMFAAYRAHGRLLDAVTSAAVYHPPLRERHAGLMEGVVTAIANHLERSQAAGITPAEVNSYHVAFSLAWMLERGFNFLLRAVDTEPPAPRLAAAAEVIWRTVEGHG